MLQEVEVGRLLREPLKGKPSRIHPRVKVFRSKFETTPGKQFELRAQAIKRLGAALKAAGIGFADGRQTVYIQRADDSVQMVEPQWCEAGRSGAAAAASGCLNPTQAGPAPPGTAPPGGCPASDPAQTACAVTNPAHTRSCTHHTPADVAPRAG